MSAAAKVYYWPTTNRRTGETRWYFRRVARNGKVTDSSQGYASSSGARRAIKRRWPDVEPARVSARPPS